jgi:hypothetical protein
MTLFHIFMSWLIFNELVLLWTLGPIFKPL